MLSSIDRRKPERHALPKLDPHRRAPHEKSGRRFYYYRCAHKNKLTHCDDRRFVNVQTFEAEVKRNAQLIVLPDERKERFLAKVENWESEGVAASKAQIEELRPRLQVIRQQIADLNTAFVEARGTARAEKSTRREEGGAGGEIGLSGED